MSCAVQEQSCLAHSRVIGGMFVGGAEVAQQMTPRQV